MKDNSGSSDIEGNETNFMTQQKLGNNPKEKQTENFQNSQNQNAFSDSRNESNNENITTVTTKKKRVKKSRKTRTSKNPNTTKKSMKDSVWPEDNFNSQIDDPEFIEQKKKDKILKMIKNAHVEKLKNYIFLKEINNAYYEMIRLSQEGQVAEAKEMERELNTLQASVIESNIDSFSRTKMARTHAAFGKNYGSSFYNKMSMNQNYRNFSQSQRETNIKKLYDRNNEENYENDEEEDEVEEEEEEEKRIQTTKKNKKNKNNKKMKNNNNLNNQGNNYRINNNYGPNNPYNNPNNNPDYNYDNISDNNLYNNQKNNPNNNSNYINRMDNMNNRNNIDNMNNPNIYDNQSQFHLVRNRQDLDKMEKRDPQQIQRNNINDNINEGNKKYNVYDQRMLEQIQYINDDNDQDLNIPNQQKDKQQQNPNQMAPNKAFKYKDKTQEKYDNENLPEEKDLEYQRQEKIQSEKKALNENEGKDTLELMTKFSETVNNNPLNSIPNQTQGPDKVIYDKPVYGQSPEKLAPNINEPNENKPKTDIIPSSYGQKPPLKNPNQKIPSENPNLPLQPPYSQDDPNYPNNTGHFPYQERQMQYYPQKRQKDNPQYPNRTRKPKPKSKPKQNPNYNPQRSPPYEEIIYQRNPLKSPPPKENPQIIPKRMRRPQSTRRPITQIQTYYPLGQNPGYYRQEINPRFGTSLSRSRSSSKKSRKSPAKLLFAYPSKGRCFACDVNCSISRSGNSPNKYVPYLASFKKLRNDITYYDGERYGYYQYA